MAQYRISRVAIKGMIPAVPSRRFDVLPGEKSGDGAVIGANSLVSHAIPLKRLAIGYPARVVGKSPNFPKELSREARA
jgi:carbonic anhydrase/acetyltransferase-like protein (isoleucine patch superfamily)